MKGIIIAGGLGTRLRPLTYVRPKPLVPLVNRPFLEYQVDLLRAHGIDDIVFATNYMADRIEAHFGDGSRFGVRMRYALEDEPLGTGGAIRNAASLFPDETVAVFNGDILTDFDIAAILRSHAERGAIGTVTLYPVARPNPFGTVILDAAGRIVEWREPSEESKKRLAAGEAAGADGSDLINAGFYVLAPEFLARIPAGQPSSIERKIFPEIIAEGGALFGAEARGFWMDLGRPEQLMAASRALLAGKVRTSLKLEPIGVGSTIAPGAAVDSQSVIGRRAVVAEGANVERSILMEGVTVGANALIRDVILDDDCVVEEAASLCADSAQTPVFGAGSRLTRGSRS